jgi:uncharacterized protein YegL
MGVFYAGKFYLTLTLEWDPTPAELTHLQVLFDKVSGVLCQATEGKHSIGQVFYSVIVGAKGSDILLHNGGSAQPDATDARLWQTGHLVDFYRDWLADVTLAVHELSHYFYGIEDEYNTADTPPWDCVDDPAAQVCMMEMYSTWKHAGWKKPSTTGGNPILYADLTRFFLERSSGIAYYDPIGPSAYCYRDSPTQGNHNANPSTGQYAKWGIRSCWEIICTDSCHGDIPYGLIYQAGGPSSAVVPAPQPIDPLVELTPVERFGLVLDRSGSMLGAKLDGLKVGADAFIDLLTEGEEFGIVSFSDTANPDLLLTDVPAGSLVNWETNQKAIVDGLNAGGSTAIGDALDLGRRVLSGVDVAAVQSLLLLTDGIENAGALTTAQAIPNLVARNVRVFTIGFGTDQNAAFLKNLASQTGGESLQIDPSLTPQQIANEIPRVMLYASGAMRADSMVTAFANIYEGLPEDLEAIPLAWGDASDPPGPPSGPPPEILSYPIEISAGSTECTMACSWSSPGLRFDLELVRPDGAPATSADISRSVEGATSYAFQVLEHPMPGTWRLRIRGQEIRGTQFQVFGSQVHPNLRLEASVDRAIVLPGDEVEVQVSLRIPERVSGLSVRAWILSPAGRWSRVELLERSGEQAEAGIYVARIPTVRDVRGSYLVCVDASRRGGRETFQPWPPSRLESGENPSAKSVVVPSMRLRKLISFVTDNSGRYVGRPLHGANSKPLSVPSDQADRVQEWKDRRRRR